MSESRPSDRKSLEIVYLAAGCFWGVQKILDSIKGVTSTTCGYLGGDLVNPTYRDVCTGRSGHAEVVEVQYDPTQISFENLLSYFWRLHDPTQLNRQGVDIGHQYRSAIFCTNEKQLNAARLSKDNFDKSKVFDKPAVTEITMATPFYPAESEHQKYFDRHSDHQVCHILRPV